MEFHHQPRNECSANKVSIFGHPFAKYDTIQVCNDFAKTHRTQINHLIFRVAHHFSENNSKNISLEDGQVRKTSLRVCV